VRKLLVNFHPSKSLDVIFGSSPESSPESSPSWSPGSSPGSNPDSIFRYPLDNRVCRLIDHGSRLIKALEFLTLLYSKLIYTVSRLRMDYGEIMMGNMREVAAGMYLV
jgi:hypothetical protein